MIICLCNNIKESQFKDKKVKKERINKIFDKCLKCGHCKENWKLITLEFKEGEK